LDEISLQIKSKEIIALVGESGSGKTILSRAIMNLIPKPGRLNSGTILYHNKNLLDLNNQELTKLRGNRIATIVSNPKGELDPLETIGQQIGNVIIHHLGVTREEAKKKSYSIIKRCKNT
jgi:ABC-type microcin C transport system duplicated ATPase subunit YejF